MTIPNKADQDEKGNVVMKRVSATPLRKRVLRGRSGNSQINRHSVLIIDSIKTTSTNPRKVIENCQNAAERTARYLEQE